MVSAMGGLSVAGGKGATTTLKKGHDLLGVAGVAGGVEGGGGKVSH